jgi:hypothetical protein
VQNFSVDVPDHEKDVQSLEQEAYGRPFCTLQRSGAFYRFFEKGVSQARSEAPPPRKTNAGNQHTLSLI